MLDCEFEIILATETEYVLVDNQQEPDLVIVSEIGPKGDDADPVKKYLSPVFSYDTEGKLIGIVYSDNSTKTFFYDSEGTLIKIESTLDSINYRKTFNYTNGVLLSITDELL
jgi:YD repeat-containing protein